MQVIGATEVNETNPSIHINRCMISSNSRVLKALTAKQLGFNCQQKPGSKQRLDVTWVSGMFVIVRGTPMRRTATGT